MNFGGFDLNVPGVSDDNSLRFDLNVPAVSDQNAIDLNNIPENINEYVDENGVSLQQSEVSGGNVGDGYLIDLNISEIHEANYLDLQIDPEELLEEDGHMDANEANNDQYGDADGVAELNNFNAAGYNGGMQPYKQKRWLTDEQQDIVYCSLLRISINGKLKKYATKEVANMYKLNIRQVQRIWEKRKGTPPGQIRIKQKPGRKKIHIDVERIPEIPLKQRTTLESLATALKVSYGTLFRRFKEGVFRRHSNAIKPHLREDNMRSRVLFCLSMLDQSTMPNDPKFKGMYNVIHIDEKWFYMTRKDENFYLHPQEEEPLRTVQSKNFIGKVMFLAAMARPRFDNDGNELFSGKIGIFPFVKIEAARRRSCNREAGTMEVKPITSVTKDIVREFLIKEVIPAIISKWPSSNPGETIYIQQDNARTHVDPSDQEFETAASSSGYDIRMVCQPPNSPDLNILDLGFFNAIQSLQRKACPRTFEQLIQSVRKAFQDYPPKKVNHVFLTLQLCMKEIMKLNGSNRYKIPHIGKGRLEREGHLPHQIDIDPVIVKAATNFLSTH